MKRILTAIFALAAAAWLATHAARAQHIDVVPGDHTLGDPNAPTRIVEYASFTCPACADFDAKSFPVLKEKYIDTGKAFYVFRVFPISEADTTADTLARCFDGESYFRFVHLLFSSQPSWDPEIKVVGDVHSDLVSVAQSAGMSPEQADACLNDAAIAETKAGENANASEDAQSSEISAVPTFVVQFGSGPTKTYDGGAPLEMLLQKHRKHRSH